MCSTVQASSESGLHASGRVSPPSLVLFAIASNASPATLWHPERTVSASALAQIQLAAVNLVTRRLTHEAAHNWHDS